MKKEIKSNSAPKAVGPYSQAVMTDNMMFLAGQIPLNEQGEMKEGTIEEKTQQVMHNLRNVLKEAGLNFANVVRTEIFLADLSNFAKVNKVYESFMSKPYPARITVGVDKLPLDAEVEISMIAVVN